MSNKIRGPVITKREWQVAELVAQGFVSKEIAEKLGVGRRTVETHREGLYTKIKLHPGARILEKMGVTTINSAVIALFVIQSGRISNPFADKTPGAS